jgi:hypothetical protein
MLRRRCPSHHVEWLCDGCWTQLTGAFEDTLPKPVRARVSRLTDMKPCANEGIGLSCEMGQSLAAYRRLALLPRFVAFGCKAVRCEEAALCSRFPDHAP